MHTLKLEIEALEVESFSTGAPEEEAGTTRGHAMIPTPPHLTCMLLTKPTDCPCTPRF